MPFWWILVDSGGFWWILVESPDSRQNLWGTKKYCWQASEISEIDFIIPDVASIDEVTEKAFAMLGNDGKIQAAKGHACAECSQPYRAASDAILGIGNSNTTAQDSGQMQNVTLKVIDGMVNGISSIVLLMIA